MKKLIFLFAVLFGFIGAKAQNPFAELGYEPKIATLSQGQFNESFDNDTIVQIGSVLFNTKSKQIVAFVQTDTMYSEATLQPDIVSRWISPDPLADHPTQIGLTPYHYAGNNPIYWTDPDGRCPWCLVWAAVEIGLAVYDAYETGATIIDPKASTTDKVLAAGGFALGAILPGGGYGAGAKKVGKEAIELTTEQSVKKGQQMITNSKVGKEGEKIVTEQLTKEAGEGKKVLNQVTGKFDDGTTTKFDNVIVDQKTGKATMTNETKTGGATYSNQQKRYYEGGENVTLTGKKAEGAAGQTINKTNTPARTTRVDPNTKTTKIE